MINRNQNISKEDQIKRTWLTKNCRCIATNGGAEILSMKRNCKARI